MEDLRGGVGRSMRWLWGAGGLRLRRPHRRLLLGLLLRRQLRLRKKKKGRRWKYKAKRKTRKRMRKKTMKRKRKRVRLGIVRVLVGRTLQGAWRV